jgi:sporulation protein YlmC with PRC-barrel domain
MRLELGTSVRCTDGKLGELADVVIDPVHKRLTHVIVRGHGELGMARLVPFALVQADGERQISLRCSVDEACSLDPVQDFAYLRLDERPPADPNWDVGIENVLAMPTYPTSDLGNYAYGYDENVGIAYDRVPKGKVEIRRSSPVSTADGHAVGHVDGFLVDGTDQITHLLLERGHLWRRREVAIPMEAITKVETDSVTVGLTTRELGQLPSVPAHGRHRA